MTAGGSYGTRVDVLPTAQVPTELLDQIRALLDASFASDFTDEDWEHTLGGWHVVVREEDAPLAHAAVVPRILDVDGAPFRTGYVEGVATAPARRGQGLGSLAVSRLTEVLRNGFELGALSTGHPSFFERLGWERWRGRTYVRRGCERVRTTDEDDGVLVLRFGPSQAVDLHGAITCDARAGDDW